jgi:hypothetical protein
VEQKAQLVSKDNRAQLASKDKEAYKAYRVRLAKMVRMALEVYLVQRVKLALKV